VSAAHQVSHKLFDGLATVNPESG
jgi:hypothetical protein